MRHLRVPLRVVLYREDAEWVAHCLEFDVVGAGATQAVAIASLTDAIAVQIAASIKYGNEANLFSPAEGRFFEMFAAGKDTVLDAIQIGPLDSVEIEAVDVREFSDIAAAPTAGAQLLPI